MSSPVRARVDESVNLRELARAYWPAEEVERKTLRALQIQLQAHGYLPRSFELHVPEETVAAATASPKAPPPSPSERCSRTPPAARSSAGSSSSSGKDAGKDALKRDATVPDDALAHIRRCCCSKEGRANLLDELEQRVSTREATQRQHRRLLQLVKGSTSAEVSLSALDEEDCAIFRPEHVVKVEAQLGEQQAWLDAAASELVRKLKEQRHQWALASQTIPLSAACLAHQQAKEESLKACLAACLPEAS